ncbi:hypothetical protein AgCh_039549 [Apium graveolens]
MSIMFVSDSLPKPRLKIKFSSKIIKVGIKSGSCESSKQLWINESCAQNVSLSGNKETMRKELGKVAPQSSHGLKLFCSDSVKDSSPVRSYLKRGPSGVIDTVLNKRQKMDRSLKRYCGNILEALIKLSDWKQATSERAQVVLILEDKGKETYDIAHVKPSKLPLPGFTKAQQSTQPLKTTSSGFEARVIRGKESRDKTRLSNADERRVNNSTLDPTSLSEPGV